MSDLAWMNDVAMSDLSPECQELYSEYKTAYRMARDAQTKFEATMNANAGLPQGKALVFNYRFGKLSIAIGDAKAQAKTSNGKAKPSLAEFLASQAAMGR